jgi:hypothetical protein
VLLRYRKPRQWNVGSGIGTFTSPTTLARTTITSTSTAGSTAAINFAAGTKYVWIDLTAAGCPLQFGSLYFP